MGSLVLNYIHLILILEWVDSLARISNRNRWRVSACEFSGGKTSFCAPTEGQIRENAHVVTPPLIGYGNSYIVNLPVKLVPGYNI